MTADIITGDALTVLRGMDDGSYQMCVTSPPYWGLRDYGVSGQLGLERTPDEYVDRMVEVFREVRRVLAKDGTLWLNIGDSYSSGGNGAGQCKQRTNVGSNMPPKTAPPGYKPKDLVGIPWLLAFALRADGWYLRQDIIWAKPNPMPESVRDRCTKSHEFVFLLSKSARYYYDADAIKEPCESGPSDIKKMDEGKARLGGKSIGHGDVLNAASARTRVGTHRSVGNSDSRNRRDVWTISPQGFAEAHFATFPEALVQPCVLAGSRAGGLRCDCDQIIATPTGTGQSDDPSLTTGRAGMNRRRRDNEGTRPITRREQRWHAKEMRESPHRGDMERMCGDAFAHYIRTDNSGARPLPPILLVEFMRRGWVTDAPPCEHEPSQPDTVLDCFAGSGTTGVVCRKLGRRFVGIELSPEYSAMARRRIADAQPGLGL